MHQAVGVASCATAACAGGVKEPGWNSHVAVPTAELSSSPASQGGTIWKGTIGQSCVKE